MGWEAHATSRDLTLDAVGTRSCPIRRGMSKNVQRQYLTCPSELVPAFPSASGQKTVPNAPYLSAIQVLPLDVS